MVGPTQQSWAALGRLPLLAHRDGAGSKKRCQVTDDLFGRNITVKQIQHLHLQGMVGYRSVDPERLHRFGALAGQRVLGGLAEHALQISQQKGRLHVLPDCLDSPAAEVLQFHPSLEHEIKGLVPPAPMVNGQEFTGRISGFIQQRSDQHFQFSIGQTHTDKTHFNPQGKPHPLAPGFLIAWRKEPDHPAFIGPVESKQFLGIQKGVLRAPAQAVCSLPQNAGQKNVAGETTVIDDQIPWLQALQLFNGQRNFTHRAGFQPGLQADLIEQIVEHRQASLRIAGVGSSILIGGFFPAKRPAQFFAHGQTQQRTVNAQEPVAAPLLNRPLGAIDCLKHAVLVQFDEGAVFELGASVSYRAAAGRFKDLPLCQLVEKLVQVALNGLDGFLEDKEHDNGEGQLALTSEVLRPHAVTSQEIRVVQFGAQGFDEGDEIGWYIVQNCSHPKVNTGMAKFVQYKYRAIKHLRANSMAVQRRPTAYGKSPPQTGGSRVGWADLLFVHVEEFFQALQAVFQG